MRQEAGQNDSGKQRNQTQGFGGFPNLQSNVCFTPNQFFDVVLPYSSRGVVRLVAYIIRMTLGWTDRDGNPRDDVYVSWSDLVKNAGISKGAIKATLDEAVAARFIECLSMGVPNTAGQTGSTALYRLRWDTSDEYVTDPEKFDGFYEGNKYFTYIPNAFYDTVVPNEKLSVIKVVGAIIRNTIGWEARRGHRKQHVSMSLSELERRTKQHRETASIGLQEALALGFLRRDQEGFFDPDKSLQRPATYSLRWEGEPRTAVADLNLDGPSTGGTVQKSDQKLSEGRFKNPTRETVQESDQRVFKNPTRETVQKSDQEAFKNPTSIERTILKNISKQQHEESDVVVEGDSLRSSVLEDLVSPTMGGFTRAAALRLMDGFPLERIRKVLDSVSLDGARSKPALVTAAVKDGRYSTHAAEAPAVLAAESSFAQAFYAGRAAGSSTVSSPSKSDLTASSPVVQALRAKKASGAENDWGSAFGRYVRSKDTGTRKLATLSLAIKVFGDEWIATVAVEDKRARAERVRNARQSHEDASRQAYFAYLNIAGERLKESNPEAYSAFEKGVTEDIERIQRSPVRSQRAKDVTIEDINSETGRIERLAKFMIERGLALGFWEWDRMENPQRFMEEAV